MTLLFVFLLAFKAWIQKHILFTVPVLFRQTLPLNNKRSWISKWSMLSPSSPAVRLVGSRFCSPPWLGAVPRLPLWNTFSYSWTCFWFLLVCCWKMSIFTLYCCFSRATLLEETGTRWLSAQSYCSYGNRPNRHQWCAPNCSVYIKQQKKRET